MRRNKQAGMLKRYFMNEKPGRLQKTVPKYLDVPYVEWVANRRIPRESREFQPVHELDDHRIQIHCCRGWEEGPG